MDGIEQKVAKIAKGKFRFPYNNRKRTPGRARLVNRTPAFVTFVSFCSKKPLDEII